MQASVRELTASKDILEAEKKTLTGEVERWKSRTHHLVEQSNTTDPEEHRRLVSVAKLSSSFSSCLCLFLCSLCVCVWRPMSSVDLS